MDAKDQKEKSRILTEVANVEKQLWPLILTKGILHSEVQAFYRKVCSSYEKIILNDHEMVELQDVEYSLWKLHYRHIDEFRKSMKKNSVNEEGTRRINDVHVKGFKSFLLQATKYYQNLMVKIKTYYGLPGDYSFSKNGGNSVSVEPKKMQKLQFLCHRFLVCLGDLARYNEQCEMSDAKNQNWSVAVTHYLEATKIWPHSGNPQNQLAVLATYVGDEFLALYHCIRSLAVREPFPDAWNNLILLFERNRLSHLPFLSSEAPFDFLNPSESPADDNSRSSNDLSNYKTVQSEQNGSMEIHLWPLFIRTISFFFIKSSLEDFPFTFASTIKELDMLMALDDEKLKASMESYQRVDSARNGPFRALQAVSIFIFIIDNLINSMERRDSSNKNNTDHFELTQQALSATFIFIGRLVNRCLKVKSLNSCPLLPALLVFSEWLASILDEVETFRSNEKCRTAMLYFFGAFLKLLKRFDTKNGVVESRGSVALWEDYELRGFAPLACVHESLDFSAHWGHAESYSSGAECRAHRICNAAMKSDKLFHKKEEAVQNVHKVIEESEKIEEKLGTSNVINKHVAVDEEEVILFKPLTRYNSAPLYNDESTREDTGDHIVPADERLRRATSMLIEQNQAQGDSSSFQSDLTNFRRNKSSQPNSENSMSSSALFSFNTGVPAGPPSLNAWVLDRGSLSNDRGKGKREMNKHSMPPIQETASASLNDLSISDSPVISSGHESVITHNTSLAYSPPIPSAPLLPDDAAWFNGIQSTFNGSQAGAYSNWTVSHQPVDHGFGVANFVDGYTPTCRMTSSEWLRQYRESQNLVRTPNHSYTAVTTGNFYGHDMSRSGLFEQFGAPLIHTENPQLHSGYPLVYGNGMVENRRDKLYQGYQRPSPYGCGAVTEPEPLLQYLKEKEWLLQQDPTLRGPTYMGS